MGSLDEFNDRWGNMARSMERFRHLHPQEEIIYASSGALFKRSGDTPFRRWTSFLNRRGNLIICENRCYFSNPVFSGETLPLLMIPIFFTIMTIIFASFAYFIGFIITRNIVLAGVCDLCISPFFFFMLIMVGLNISQRLPYEIDLDLKKMKKLYLGKYQSLTRACPLFSCFDGERTYHLLGYRVMDERQRGEIAKLFDRKG